jgi:hypothetical protein
MAAAPASLGQSTNGLHWALAPGGSRSAPTSRLTHYLELIPCSLLWNLSRAEHGGRVAEGKRRVGVEFVGSRHRKFRTAKAPGDVSRVVDPMLALVRETPAPVIGLPGISGRKDSFGSFLVTEKNMDSCLRRDDKS